ncbi:ABC transporter substrate-binding protein [Rhodococcus chondri]|uniref:ABC transporter substrate-binding protein n=1 Tax=Rhodococcus chondri TaxID=3065941 RepID=A0ABU7JPQ5_9NOCA|nr:ABC transporter substrate-binding protein [Rhodococcus sp. CC-R104]MEE2032016.1 ABC transporter substrate-binding protein [Rhodococcus sp. CC-R104]
MKRFARAVVILSTAAIAVAGCSGSETEDPLADQGGGSGEIVVGSANFPENVLLAEIYAQALETTDAQVKRQFNIGSREIYFDQVASGGITVLPEYNGALLARVDPDNPAATTEDVNAALRESLPAGLAILESAPGENKDALVVTQETADRYNLSSITDLAPVAGELVLGGPPEFATRQQGVVGLKEVYGVEFRAFTPTDAGGPITVRALEDGTIGVANIFTTDPSLDTKPFVALEDPESVFGAQNVTPLVHRDDLTDENVAVIDEVTAQLTTETLIDLVGQVVTDGRDIDVVAQEWLQANGLN